MAYKIIMAMMQRFHHIKSPFGRKMYHVVTVKKIFEERRVKLQQEHPSA